MITKFVYVLDSKDFYIWFRQGCLKIISVVKVG